MGKLIESKKKPQEAGNELMKSYHGAKQKGIPKWKSYLKSTNPDCYTLENKWILVRLDKLVKESDVKAATAIGDVILAKDSHYYGVVAKLADSDSSSESESEGK